MSERHSSLRTRKRRRVIARRRGHRRDRYDACAEYHGPPGGGGRVKITLPQCGTGDHAHCPRDFAGRECACDCGHGTPAPTAVAAAPATYSNGVDRSSDTADVARWCIDNRVPSYIVGAWVWAEFSGKPDADVRTALKGAGFRWNKRRAVWQHSCGVYRRRSNNDPRATYGRVRNFEGEDDDNAGQ